MDDWQESAEFGGRYRVQVNLDGRSRRFYFDTYEEAEPWSDLGGVIEYVEPLVEDVPLIGRSDTQTLDALSSAGLLDVDLVEFGPGVKFDDLQMSLIVPGKIALEHPEKPWTNGGLLSVRWGAAGFDVEVPSETYGFSGTKLGADELLSGAWQDYRLGEGIEGFLFADKTVVRLEEILAHATIVPARQLVSRGAGVLYFDAEAYAGIQFDNDIRADEVRITRDGADLRVTLTDGTTSILVPGWFSNPPQVPNVSIHFALDPTLAPEDITRTALTLRGTPLADFLQGVDGFPNAIYGEDGADRLLGGTGDDWIEGGDGFDQITGGGGNDRLDGGGFADSIDGESGNDLVIGANGDDRLSGGEGNDILDGGEGEDYLTGGPGDDVYVFGHGYGSDFVFDLEEMAEGGGAETIRFGSGVTPTDVRVTRDRADLIVQLNEGSDALTINAWFTEAGGQIENFVFEDGTVWHAGDVEALLPPREQATEGDDALLGTTGADVLIGLGGSDNLEGFAGDDVLQGGPGADYMGGGRGDDVYHFQPGDGADEIWDEGGYDRLVFGAGILPADIQISRDPYSLFLTVGQGGDALSILDWVYGPTSRIEALEFADGTVWGEADIWSRFPAFVPSEGADLVLGSQLDDDLFGLGANDELWGYEGNDLLHGGEGDDYLVGGTGRNLVEGGSGNDTIAEETFAGINLVIGGAGDDEIYQDHAPAVLAFNAGDGNDYVSTVAGQPLVISLGGVSVEEIELRREPGALIMQIAPGDSLMLGGYTPGGNWPSGTLQIVGEDVRAYDLNAVARSFYDAQKDALPWDASIASSEHLLWASETHAIGGAIAYQYATTGSTEALSKAQKADVIGDPSFAVAPQPIAAPPANQSPLVELPLTEQHAAEDRPFTFVIPGNTFSDPDGGPLAYHVALSSGEPLPTWLSFDPETRMLAGTPAQADVAALEITVTATDSEGLSASSTFTLTVEESNDAPVAAAPIAAQSASEDVLFWLPIPADAFFDEDPGDTLTYEASLADGSPLPGWLAFDGIALSGTPGEGDAGVRMVQLRATDAAGATASQEFELIVRAVNDAPVVLTPIADRSFEAGSPFSFSIPVGTFADEDIGDSLSLSASAYGGGSLPGWLSFDATTAT
ncbi:MAG TPA: putative Ig domain-containing protein, partial [Rhodothermales bacterium]